VFGNPSVRVECSSDAVIARTMNDGSHDMPKVLQGMHRAARATGLQGEARPRIGT